MEKIQLTARMRIHPGKLAEFKALSRKCVAVVKEKEPGAIQYDWFFNADQTECVVRETYASSEAVFAHMANVGPLLGQLLAISDFSGEVFGNPPEALMKAFEAFDVTYYRYEIGLEA